MKRIDQAALDAVRQQAAASVRRRANHNLHPVLEDPIQRFLNAVEPGSYVRPHRHPDPARWELFLALEGAAAVLLFDAAGVVSERVEISGLGSVRAAEVPAGAWHALASLEPGTVLFEFKPGPYRPLSDKDFGTWAPPEGDPRAREFERW